MWEMRTFLSLFDGYTRNRKARDRYDDPIGFNRNQANQESLVLYLIYDKRQYLSFADRMRVRVRKHKERQLLGNALKREHSMASAYKIQAYGDAKEKLQDVITECEKRDFIRMDYRSIILLPAGRKFLRWLQFGNAVAAEFRDLTGLLSVLGLGTVAGIVIANAPAIAAWVLKLAHA